MPGPGRSHDTTSKVVLQTVAAYEQSADKYLSRRGRRRYRQSPLLRRLLALLPKHIRLPDLGAASRKRRRHLAAASVIHLPKEAVRVLFVDLRDVMQPGGVLAATVAHGMKSRILRQGGIPGRYFARWTKGELNRTFRVAGWQVIELIVVT